jgi:putative ABC transport system ATP-binding protein
MSEATAEPTEAKKTAKSSRPIIECRGIMRTFWRAKERLDVLDGLDLDIAEGSFEALMGPSGSGKTTLLNLIAGLDRPTAGKLVVAGTEVSAMGDAPLARWRSQTIGFVFQHYNLIPVLTAL